jgi:CRISPR-associated endonuclease Cas3-HD
MDLKSNGPFAFKNQLLSDHIEGCLNEITKFLGTNINYLRIVQTRLLKAGAGTVALEDLEEGLRLGVVTHDLGKAYRFYQERKSFEDHEILSAVSCYKVSEKFANLKFRTLLLMAVLNHHQAFRESIPSFVKGESLKKAKDVAKFGLCNAVYNLQYILGRVGLRVEEVFATDDFESILDQMVKLLKTFLVEKFEENRRWLKLYCLLMFPIVLADNLDASKNREGLSNPTIIKELMRSIEDE